MSAHSNNTPQPDQPSDLLRTIFNKHEVGYTIELLSDLSALIDAAVAEAEIRGMEKAKSRVLRRTEIPSDAKNPTRDWVVILGEEIADFIQRDIAALRTTGNGQAGQKE